MSTSPAQELLVFFSINVPPQFQNPSLRRLTGETEIEGRVAILEAYQRCQIVPNSFTPRSTISTPLIFPTNLARPKVLASESRMNGARQFCSIVCGRFR